MNIIIFLFQTPRNEDEWRQISTDYHKIWNFPLCLGAMDGKHILMEAPAVSGSEFTIINLHLVLYFLQYWTQIIILFTQTLVVKAVFRTEEYLKIPRFIN